MSDARGPRSTLVALFLLVLGVAGLIVFMQWYWDHLKRMSSPPPPVTATRPSAAPVHPPSPTPKPPDPPSDAELAGLAQSSPGEQTAAIALLRKRAMTPALVQAVRACRPANQAIAAKLDCLKARIPEPATIDWIISRLPSEDDSVWPSDVDRCECLVIALAERVEEDPERIVRKLFPFAVSYLARLREPALQALAKAPLTAVPPDIRRKVSSAWHEGLAIRAAFALRVDERDPDLVKEWIFHFDPKSRQTARSELARTPRPSAARLLVKAAVENRQDTDLQSRLRLRESTLHDTSEPLAAIALDEAQASDVRQSALELLGSIGSADVLPRLAQLQTSQDPALRAYADAAVAAIVKRFPNRRPGHN